jgi:hypothetical protein
MDLDAVMFEVSEASVMLRQEEWATVLTAMELQRGGRAIPIDPEALDRAQRRILAQIVTDDEGEEDDD